LVATRNRVGAQAVGGVTAASTGSGGSGGGGGQTGSDNRTPSGPTTLTPSNSGVTWVPGVGSYLGHITLTWVLPTTATDGTAMAPTQSHLYRLQGTSGVFSTLTTLDYPDHSVNLTNYPPGSTWQFKVRCTAANGKVSAFSNTITVTFDNSASATGPSQPSDPAVDPEGVVMRIIWDGLAFGGGPMEPDFQYCTLMKAYAPSMASAVPVDTFITAGTLYDGPLNPGETWYYQLVPYNMLDQAGTPSNPVPGTVQKMDGATIASGTITTDQMEATLAQEIHDAISSTQGNTVPGAHVFYGSSPDPTAVAGDLWFNPNANNAPYIFGGGDPTNLANWTSYRDKIVNDAFTGAADDSGTPGTTITAPYLLPSVVRGKLIDADTILAKDIITSGSISSGLGLFGLLDAADINAGYINAARIHADSLDSSKLIVADLANLCDEPEFDSAKPTTANTYNTSTTPPTLIPGTPLAEPWAPLGWIDPNAAPAGPNGRHLVTDHPNANASTGYIYSIIGNGTKQLIRNARTFPALQDDQFFGQFWIRKIGNGTTGTVTFALEVDLKGGGTSPDPTQTTPKTVFFSKTYTVSDAPTTWTSLPIFFDPVTGAPTPLGQNGQIAPDNSNTPQGNPKPAPKIPPTPWTPKTQALPAGAFQARAMIIVENLASGQEIQIASVWVRRKNAGHLIVDGTIDADNIQAGAITGAEIAAQSIQAGNIVSDSITSTQIHAGSIDGTDLRVDVFSTFFANAGMFRVGQMAVDTSDPPKPVGPAVAPYFQIDSTQMIYQKDKGAAPLFLFAFQDNATTGVKAGQMSWQSSTTTAAKWQIDTDGIRFYGKDGTSSPPVIALSVNALTLAGKNFAAGSAYFQGDISGSTMTAGTITGALIQTTTAGTGKPRIFMDSTHFEVDDANGQIIVRFIPSAAGVIHMDTGTAAATKPRFWFDTGPTGGMRWYKKSSDGTPAFNLDFNDGSLSFNGDITGSTMTAGTITGALIRTSATDPKIMLNNTLMDATDKKGDSVFRINLGATTASMYIRSNAPVTGDQSRWQLDLSGFRIWDKNGVNTVYLQASGDASFSGTITASNLDASNTLTGSTWQTAKAGVKPRIWLDDSSGIRAMDSTGTYTFQITVAGDAFFAGTLQAASGSFKGSLTAASGSFTGTLTAASIMTGTINGAKFSGSPTTNNGTINNPGTINSSGGVVETSSGPNRVVLVGDQIQIYNGGTNPAGLIMANNHGTSTNMLVEGYGSTGYVDIGYNNSTGVCMSVYNGSSSPNGAIYSGALRDSNISSITGYAPLYVQTTGAGFIGSYTSSIRYKSKVAQLELDPAFLKIETATWRDKPNLPSMQQWVGHPYGRQRNTGFTAENLDRIGLSDTVVYDTHSRPQGIQQPAIMAHTVRYTQWLVEQVNELRARVAALEGAGV
jgi:hypothetical protein